MSSRSNTKRRNTTTPEYYASGTFHGLKFFDTFEDNTDVDKPLICTPDISLIENNTKGIFDFSHCDFSNEYDQITVIFNGLTLGDGITLNNALNIDAETAEESNLDGHFTVTGKYNKVIIVDVDSIDNPQNYDKKYKKENFVDEFEILTSASGISTDTNNMVKNFFNTLGDESFLGLGVRLNDKIRFNTGTNAGNLYDIISILVDENDHEILGLSASDGAYSIAEENRFNSETNFDLFRVDSQFRVTTGDIYAEVYNALFAFSPILDMTLRKYKFSDYYVPTLQLKTNVTYIFNALGQSENFSISTTPDGTWNNGTEYPGLVRFKNALLIHLTSPDTLYYFDKKIRNAGGLIKITSNTNYYTTVDTLNSQFSYITSDVSSRIAPIRQSLEDISLITLSDINFS